MTPASLQKDSDALSADIRQQWVAALLKLRTTFDDVAAAEVKTAAPSAVEPLTKALKDLDKTRVTQRAELHAFGRGVASQVGKLGSKFARLLKELQKAAGPAKVGDHDTVNLQAEKAALLSKLETQFNGLLNKMRQAVRQSFGAKVPKIKAKLLNALVDEQAKLLSLLTVDQFSAVQKFALSAGTALLHAAASA
ncbi:hypothetical protein ONE63_000107 [Megalurothrips usitatus]|uniref:Uncharacterized protein n=1 Tax=Megalurothrips usitatus TaxID=439358 RepID=A0AAV7Y496_9NEOP|nr:hypothetical protein ONE63_000107 [Megalurothrips usitatus]